MDEPQSPDAPPEQSAAPRQPTAREVRDQYLEYCVWSAWAFAWFLHDGWFNSQIKATGFNKTLAVPLAGYAIFALIMCLSAQRNIGRQPPQPPDLAEARSQSLWAVGKFLFLLIWYLQDRHNPNVHMKTFDWVWLAVGIGCALCYGVAALRRHLALESQPPEPPPPAAPSDGTGAS
jgi:hypothetical protein